MAARQVVPLDLRVEDNEVIARVRGGEADAFGILVRKYSQRLYRVAVSVLRNDGEAEEVVQETFVRAYAHLNQFEGRAQFSTWLTRIAFHESLARKQARRRFVDLDLEGDHPHQPLFHHEIAPDRKLLNREASKRLSRSLRSLPRLYRESFTLVYIDEVSRTAAAAALRITPENLKVRLHRARRLLQEQLTAQETRR